MLRPAVLLFAQVLECTLKFTCLNDLQPGHRVCVLVHVTSAAMKDGLFTAVAGDAVYSVDVVASPQCVTQFETAGTPLPKAGELCGIVNARVEASSFMKNWNLRLRLDSKSDVVDGECLDSAAPPEALATARLYASSGVRNKEAVQVRMLVLGGSMHACHLRTAT